MSTTSNAVGTLTGKFNVQDISEDSPQSWEHWEDVPEQHQWAFWQIFESDCGSLSVGSTVYWIS